MLPTFILLVTSSVSLLTAKSTENSAVAKLEYASVISSEELQDLKQFPSISFVYFVVKNTPGVRAFLKEYDKAAQLLKVYGITFSVFDCDSTVPAEKLCMKEDVHRQVYTYQNGAELLILGLDTMFDVNSMMTNALQLVLLQEVPIVQSRKEMQDLQKGILGKQDMFIAYLEAFGIEEHRIFLEIAYAFQDRYKFVVTTEFNAIEGLRDNKLMKTPVGMAMWVMFCSEFTLKDFSTSGACSHILYRGEVTLTAMATFVKRLSEKTLYHLPTDGLCDASSLTDDAPSVFVYTSKEVQDIAATVIEMAEQELQGSARVVVLDMDNKDCKALAEQQGFMGKLPGIGVLQMGAMTFMDEDKEMSAKNVLKFVKPLIFPHYKQSSVMVPHITNDDPQHVSFFVDKVTLQDDQVVETVIELNKQETDLRYVPALVKHNFNTSVRSTSLKIVLFYLSFDHISKAFLQEFGHAGEILAKNYHDPHVLARVNCFESTDLCAAENITTYPTLRIYKMDENTHDYKGFLDSQSVIKTVKLLQLQNPVMLTSEQDVEKFMKGEHPHQFHYFTSSSVLLLMKEKNSDVENVFHSVAKALSSVTAFGAAHGDLSSLIAEKYGVSVPSVLAYHRSDINKPVRVLANEDITEPSLTDLVKDSLITFVPELSVMNLPALFAKKKPLAILFVDVSDPDSKVAMETFTKTAMTNHIENTTFCWMNAQSNTLGSQIVSVYTWTVTLPMITLLDHQKGELFNHQPDELSVEGISEWLMRVQGKKVKPSKILAHQEWLPPGPHYDFLSMMEAKGHGDYEFQDSQKRQTVEGSTSHYDEESVRLENELRLELLELKQLRLQQEGSQKMYVGKSEPSTVKPHLEL